MRSLASLVLLTVAGLWPLAGEDPLESRFPMEAKGNIPFQSDVVFFLEDGVPAPEVELAVPRDALAERGDDSLHVRISVEMLDDGGNPRVRYQTEMTLAPDSTRAESRFPVPERWLRLHPRWHPGTAGIRISVEDVTRVKVGLLDRLQGNHPQGEVAGRVPWPDEPGDETPALSGLLFAWDQSDDRPAGGPGLRSVRGRLQPNPFRYYGLFQPVVTVYWERYGLPPGAAAGDPLSLRYEIVRLPDGLPVVRTEESVVAETGIRWELERFDVSGLATGSYRLDVSIRSSKGAELASTSGEFQVLWQEQRWTENEQTLLAYARILLTSSDYDSFATMSRGARTRFLREFWQEREPTAPGAPNPLETRFLERIGEANERFGDSYRPGYETDMGRTYIRFGPPDEISINLNPQDRELLRYVLPEEIDDPTEDVETRLRRSKRRSTRDNSAYEIWEYHMRGDPLLPEYTGMQTGLKFIFVDELGYGDYALVYSNLPGSLR